jgi:hypothetical protein
LFILLLRWCSTHTHTHAQTMKILYIYKRKTFSGPVVKWRK